MSKNTSRIVMSRGLSFTVCLTATASLFLSACDPAGDLSRIPMADNQPEHYPTVQGIKRMAELIAEESAGEMNLLIYSDGALGSETSTLRQVRDGELPLNRVSAAHASAYSDKLDVLMLPFLFRDSEHMWQVLESEVGDELLDSLRPAGLIGLGWQDSGARSFYATSPIKGLADLQGMDVRVMDGQMMHATMRALGASPRSTSFEELYEALDTGVVDAAENNVPSYYTTGHFNVAPYYTLSEYVRIPEVIVASERWWNALNERQQQIIRDAAREQASYQRLRWQEREQESMRHLSEEGVTILELDEQEREAFRKAVEPLYEVRKDLADMIQQIREIE